MRKLLSSRVAALLAAVPLLVLPARAANNPDGTEVPCRPVEDDPVCTDVVWPGATGVVARVSCGSVAFELLGLTNGVCEVERVTRYVSDDPAKTDCPPPDTSIDDEPIVPYVTWVLACGDESEEGSGVHAAPSGAVHGAVSCTFTVRATSPCGEAYARDYGAEASVPGLTLSVPPLVGVNDLVEPCLDPAAPVSLAEHLSTDADDLSAVSYSAAGALLVEIFGAGHARVVAADGEGGITTRFVSPPMSGSPKLEGTLRSDAPGDAEVSLRAEFADGLVCGAVATTTVVGVEYDAFCYNRMDPFPQVEITDVEGLDPGGEATVFWRVLPDVADPQGLETNATFAVSSEPGSHEWAGAAYTNRFGNAGRAALRYTVSFDARGNAVVTNGVAQPDRRAIETTPPGCSATIQMGDALAEASTNALGHLSATPEIHLPSPEGNRPDYFLRDIRLFAKEPSEWLTNEVCLASLGATALRADLLGVAHDTAAAIELAGPALVPVARDPSAPAAPGDDTARLRVDGLPGCIVKGAYTWTVEEGGVSLAFDTTEGVSVVPAYTGSFDLSGGGSLADAILLPRVIGTAASDRAEDARISFTLVPDAGEDSGNPAAFRGQTLAAEHRLTVFDTRWTVCRPDGGPGRSAARDDLLECDLDLRPAIRLDAFEPRLGEPLVLSGSVRSYCDVVRDIRVNGHPVPGDDIRFLGHPVSEFQTAADLEAIAWGMEPPYDVAFSVSLDSFSASAVIVEAYGTVSAHPGRLRIPVAFDAGATNGVAGTCGASHASPAWSSLPFDQFYRQDGWDFLYKFEVDHAGAGAAVLDLDDTLRCVAQGEDSALYRLERPLVFLPAPVESTAAAPGAASLRGPGIIFVDSGGSPQTVVYQPEEAAGESSASLFPSSLGVLDAANADEWWLGSFAGTNGTFSLSIADPFDMDGIPDDAVLALSKTSDPNNVFPGFSATRSWSGGDSPPDAVALQAAASGVATFELSLTGTGVSSRDRVKVSAAFVDLDIDSDNDDGFGMPEGSAEEDECEEASPGKLVFVADGDADGDWIPDFADGYGLYGSPDSSATSGAHFIPLNLRLPDGLPSDSMSLRIQYSASDPAAVTRDDSGFLIPAPGRFRLWKKPGEVARALEDWIPPTGTNSAVSLSSLGLVPGGVATFHLEAVSPSSSLGSDSISVEIIPSDWSDSLPVASDSVAVTALSLDVELWGRDPETGDEYECTGMVLNSHPVPQLELDVDDARLTADGALEVDVSGTMRDWMSEVCVAPDRLADARIVSDGETLSTIAFSYGVADPPWRLVDSTTSFSRTIRFENPDAGSVVISLETDENAAGEKGFASVAVVLDEEIIPPAPVSGLAAAISFDMLPATNCLDTATVFLNGGTNLAVETESFLPDLVYTGAVSFAVSAPLAFSDSSNDVFQAWLEWVEPPCMTNSVVATFQETSPTSLVFEAEEFLSTEIRTRLRIVRSGPVLDTNKGYLNPFRAKLVSSLSDAETLALFTNGWLMAEVDGDPLVPVSETDGLFLADEGDTKSRVFVSLADRSGLVPEESFQAGSISFQISDESESSRIVCSSELVEPLSINTDDSAIPSFPRNLQIRNHPRSSAPQHPTWTIDDAWFMYELFFGTYGVLTHRAYDEIGGVVDIDANVSGTYKTENFFTAFFNNDPPVLTLNPNKIKTPARAAVTIYRALKRLSHSVLGKTEFQIAVREQGDANHLPDYAELGDGEVLEEGLKQFFRNGYSDLAETICDIEQFMEMGGAILNTPLGIVIEIAEFEDNIRNKRYGRVTVQTILNCISAVATINRLNKSVSIRRGASTLIQCEDDFVRLMRQSRVRHLSDRPQAMRVLRAAMEEGRVTNMQMRFLVEKGHFSIGSRSANYKVLAKHVRDMSRGARKTANHHDLPLEFQEMFLSSGLDPNGIGTKLEIRFHSKIHGFGEGKLIFNHQWERFFEHFDDLSWHPAAGDWKHWNPADPAGSIETFMFELRSVYESFLDQSLDSIGKDVFFSAWPYPLTTP